MKKLCIYILLFGSLALLSGCKYHFISNLYVPDLRKVASNEDAELKTPATFEIQIPSQDECKEFSATFTDLASDLVSDISPRGCVRKGAETYLLVDVDIPIFYGYEKWLETSSIFGILMVKDNIGISIYLMNNLEMYKILNSRLSEKFNQTIDVSDLKITIVVNSSLNEEVVLVQGAFVNRKPVDILEEVSLRRRDRVIIVLSDVGVSHFESKGLAFAFILKI